MPSLWRRFSSITANSGTCVGLTLGPGSWTLEGAPSAWAGKVLFLEHLLGVSPSAYTSSSDSHSSYLSNPFYR